MPNNLSQSGSRLVRLLLFLLASEDGVSRDEVYNAVPGYDNEATRNRIFEQDLSCLEASVSSSEASPSSSVQFLMRFSFASPESHCSAL